MVGQKNLINKLMSYTIETFPRTLLLLGERGCGKHTLVKDIISPHLKLDVVDITENISIDYIVDIQLKAVPLIYVIDLSKLTDKQQNIILKFVEEPLSTSYVILLGESKQSILDTVYNRSVVYYFESYTAEELLTFANIANEETKTMLVKVCTTPGQVIETPEEKVKGIYELCNKIANKLNVAPFPNTLKISQLMNYREETDKFDVRMFFKTLTVVLHDSYKDNNKSDNLKLYYKTVEYQSKLVNSKLNKEHLVENFLTVIWNLSRA